MAIASSSAMQAPAGKMKRLTNRRSRGRTSPSAPSAIQAATMVTTRSSEGTADSAVFISRRRAAPRRELRPLWRQRSRESGKRGGSFYPHARLGAVVGREKKNAGAVARCGENHAFGDAEFHLPGREIRNDRRQAPDQVLGPISGFDAGEYGAMTALAELER